MQCSFLTLMFYKVMLQYIWVGVGFSVMSSKWYCLNDWQKRLCEQLSHSHCLPTNRSILNCDICWLFVTSLSQTNLWVYWWKSFGSWSTLCAVMHQLDGTQCSVYIYACVATVAVVKSRDMHWGLLAQKDHKEVNLSSLRMLLVADGANPCE